MSGNHPDTGKGKIGGNGNDGRRGVSDGAVLLDRQYVWPGDLTEIPDWVYTDETIYEREIERIFHGPTWNYVALEAEIPKAGRFHPLECRPDAGGGRAREGRRDQRVREPLRASRRRVLPRARRQRQGVRLPLPPVDLRPQGQPARRAVQARRRRQGRHAGGLQAGRARTAQAQGHRRIAASCSRPMPTTWSRSRSISARRSCASSRRRSTAASSRCSAITATRCRATGSSTMRT